MPADYPYLGTPYVASPEQSYIRDPLSYVQPASDLDQPEDPDEEDYDSTPDIYKEAATNERMLNGEIPDYTPELAPAIAGPLPAMPADLSANLPTGRFEPPPAPDWMHRIGAKLGLNNAPQQTSPQWAGDHEWKNPNPPGFIDDLGRLAELYKQAPVMTKPNWLERLAAAGAGAAAGYSNAARRAAPIDIAKVQHGILYPGYDAKLGEWQSKVAGAEKAAQVSAEVQAVQMKQAQIRAEAALRQAQAQMAYERAGYYRHLATLDRNYPVPVTQELEDISQGAFKKGQMIPAAQAMKLAEIAAGRYQKPEATLVISTPEMAARSGQLIGSKIPVSTYNAAINANSRADLSVPGLRIRAAQGDQDAQTAVDQMDKAEIARRRAMRDPLADILAEERIEGERQKRSDAEQKTLDGILADKQKQEAQVLQQRTAALQQAQRNGSSDDQIRAINEKARVALQTIQDGFAAKWRGHNLKTEDYDVQQGPNGFVYKKRVAPPPPKPNLQQFDPRIRNAPGPGRGPVDLNQFVRQ